MLPDKPACLFMGLTTIGNAILVSPTVSLIGQKLGQSGSFRGAVVGASIGGFLGSGSVAYIFRKQKGEWRFIVLPTILGGTMATIGYAFERQICISAEFLIASGLEILPAYYFLALNVAPFEQPGAPSFIQITLISTATSLLSSGGVYIIGTLLNQKGSIKKSLIGASIGSALTFLFCQIYPLIGLPAIICLPPLGATIGYNWGR